MTKTDQEPLTNGPDAPDGCCCVIDATRCPIHRTNDLSPDQIAEWEPGIGSAQIRADSDAQEAREGAWIDESRAIRVIADALDAMEFASPGIATEIGRMALVLRRSADRLARAGSPR